MQVDVKELEPRPQSRAMVWCLDSLEFVFDPQGSRARENSDHDAAMAAVAAPLSHPRGAVGTLSSERTVREPAVERGLSGASGALLGL